MGERRFADDLSGAGWDRVRGVRRQLLGDDGEELALEEVPAPLQHLLPYASLLTTGEEGALAAFWDAMGVVERGLVMNRVDEAYHVLRAFALGSMSPRTSVLSPPPPALQEALGHLLQDVARRVAATPPSRERDAFLDLVRFYDMFHEEWFRRSPVGAA
jgi:hypothetical protein